MISETMKCQIEALTKQRNEIDNAIARLRLGQPPQSSTGGDALREHVNIDQLAKDIISRLVQEADGVEFGDSEEVDRAEYIIYEELKSALAPPLIKQEAETPQRCNQNVARWFSPCHLPKGHSGQHEQEPPTTQNCAASKQEVVAPVGEAMKVVCTHCQKEAATCRVCGSRLEVISSVSGPSERRITQLEEALRMAMADRPFENSHRNHIIGVTTHFCTCCEGESLVSWKEVKHSSKCGYTLCVAALAQSAAGTSKQESKQ